MKKNIFEKFQSETKGTNMVSLDYHISKTNVMVRVKLKSNELYIQNNTIMTALAFSTLRL